MISLNDHQRKQKPEGVAGRDFVSWSQLSTFRQCPLRYQFRYLDKLEPEFVSAALLVGSSLHAAFEHHHRVQLEGCNPSTASELLEVFWSEWKHRAEESPKIRFGAREDIGTIHQLAQRILDAFSSSEQAKCPGALLGIEERFKESLIEGHPDLLGIVDLIYVDDDGSLVIRDYKSSRSRWKQSNAESNAGQLMLYGELAKRRLGFERFKVEFVVVTKAKAPTVECFTVGADSRRLQRVLRIAAQTLSAIDTGVFYPNHSPMNCGSCPYRSACSRWR